MQLDALTPKFAHQFQCTKNECPENCCSDLNVVLDKESQDLYTTHPALIPLVQEHLIETGDKSGSITLNKDSATKTCPLLDADDGLCIMHRDFGEDTLPQICATYPREANWHGEDLIVTLSESCPEVARLLIETDDAMELGFGAFNLPDAMQLADNTDNAIDPNRYHYLQSVLTLLRHKEQPLELRLFIISLYTQRAEAILNNQEEDSEALPKLTDLFFTLIGEGYFEEQAAKLNNPDKHSLGLVLLNILRQQGMKGSLAEDIKRIFFALEVDATTKFDEVHLARLNQSDRNHLTPLLEKHPDALENILVNWLLTDLFPLKATSLIQGWKNMMLRYLFLKTLISGTGLHRGQLEKEDLIRITYRFSRSINLSTTLYKLEASLESRQLNDLSTYTHALNL